MKRMLSGNEAIARGAYEAGVRFASGYPGTPSTEILETLLEYPRITCEWAPNEKVALEAASGAALAGARALATMKHVGLNVAADPLLTLPYIGVNGGLVVVVADDPNMHSSQNEQDSRHYARFAKVPMLEPSDSQEAKDFVQTAYGLSEEYDTVVLVRSSTRVSHSESIVSLGRPRALRPVPGPVKNPAKHVMVPVNARTRHRVVEERIGRLKAFVESFSGNRIEWGRKDMGIVTSGVSYQYAKEVFPEASYLKLGMVYPLPEKLITRFAKGVKALYVVEELDPFLEEQIRMLGIKVTGKALLPCCGEFDPDVVREALMPSHKKGRSAAPPEPIPARPPNLCPGCPHRGVFHILNRLKVYVTGDIGCYTLAYMPPLSSLDTALCMGAGIGQAHGITKAMGERSLGKVAAVIGDSTFIHSGITGLLNSSYNQAISTVIILDNRFTAMTGGQEHPGTGCTMMGEATTRLDYAQLCAALGVKHIRTVNPYDLDQTLAAIKEEIERPALSVIIAEGPCIFNKKEFTPFAARYATDEEACIGCRSCILLGCPAIGWIARSAEEREAGPGEKKKSKGFARIDPLLCIGCSICEQVCKSKAIAQAEAPR